MKFEQGQPISAIIQNIIDNKNQIEKFTIRELIDKFQYRSFGVFILIFAIFSILPFTIIPGVAVILGIPISLLGLQLGFGMDRPWLPKKFGEMELKEEKIQRILIKILPYIKSMEKISKPRWFLFSTKIFECLIGWCFVVLGILLMLPIPFSNMFFGLIILLLSIGLIEKDGIVLLFGILITSALCIVFISALLLVGRLF